MGLISPVSLVPARPGPRPGGLSPGLTQNSKSNLLGAQGTFYPNQPIKKMSYAQLFNPKLKKRVEEIKKLKIDPGSVSGACLWPLRRTGHLLPEPTRLFCICLFSQGQVGRHIAGLFGAPSPSPTAGRSQRLPQSVQEEEGLSGSGQVHYCLYLSVYLYIYRFTDIQIDGYR